MAENGSSVVEAPHGGRSAGTGESALPGATDLGATPSALDTQAARVIAKFGSPYKLVAAMKLVDSITRSPTSVYRWTYDKSKGGTGGRIPAGAMDLVLEAARMDGVFLSSDDLDPRRK